MIKTSRRNFLSLLGVSTAAGPLAVKAASDAEISKLTNIGINGIGVGLSGAPPPDGFSYQDSVIKASDYISMFGVPDVIKQKIRQNSQYVHGLDVDLASKRSWSMSVKIQEQRERNYKRYVEAIEKAGWIERSQKALQKTLGFQWPW